MDKISARKLMLSLKALVFLFLASTSFSAFANYVYLSGGPGGANYLSSYGNNCCCKKPVTYYGPDCCCMYWSKTNCGCGVVWVPCHWDTYGNYVPGYWMSFQR